MTLDLHDSSSGDAHNQVSRLHGTAPDPQRPQRKAIAPGQPLIGGKWVEAAAGETLLARVEPAANRGTEVLRELAGLIDGDLAESAERWLAATGRGQYENTKFFRPAGVILHMRPRATVSRIS